MKNRMFSVAMLLALLPAPTALAQSSVPPAAPPSPERAEARHKVRAACAAAIEKFCSNVERAKGAMRSCLEQNQASLSVECNTARAERAALRAKDKS